MAKRFCEANKKKQGGRALGAYITFLLDKHLITPSLHEKLRYHTE